MADARLWAKTLSALGFDCTFMLDEEATYSNIVAALEQLVKTSRRGDSIVWQYAGHGTQVPDVNGDEADGDSPGQDEAICPIDLQAGRMVTDDEIGAIIQQLQPGVAFTMMMDCCHSGTLNRFGVGDPAGAGGIRDERARFLPLTEELKQAYLQFAQSPTRSARSLTRSRSRGALQNTSEVLFSACLSTEVAFESNGQGEFTLRGDATAERARRCDHERRLRQCRHRGLWLGAPANADDHVCRDAPGPADLPGLRRRPVQAVNSRPGGVRTPPPHGSRGRPMRSKRRPANCGRCKPCRRTSRTQRPPPRRPRSRPPNAAAPPMPAPAADDQFVIAPGATMANGAAPFERRAREPVYRPLKIFTLDPSISRLDGAIATLQVPYEPLQPGPRGSVFEVDNDDGYQQNQRVDLDDPLIVMSSGLDPTPSDPRFHQQMVYAVASSVHAVFRTALGRQITWKFPPRPGEREARLLLRPHALKGTANAFYDPDDRIDRLRIFPGGADVERAGTCPAAGSSPACRTTSSPTRSVTPCWIRSGRTSRCPPIPTSRLFMKRWPIWWRSSSTSAIATCWSGRLRSPGATCNWRRC